MNLKIKDIHIGGELEKKIDKLIYFFLFAFILFNILPLCLLFIHVIHNNNFLIILVCVWFLWNTLSLYIIYISKIEPNVIYLYSNIPLLILQIIIILSYNYYKVSYSNSDDPEEIKKFQRIRKIRNIL